MLKPSQHFPFKKPSLILDEKKCRANIKAMAQKAAKKQVDFRPHFKTHISLEVAQWFREAGVQKITVSSLTMANYFASDDWTDITVAFPVNILEHELINKLAAQIQLNLLFESHESIQALSANLTQTLGAFIKIDSGYGRTGIPANNYPAVQALIQGMGNQIQFKGFLTHAGNSYQARNIQSIKKVHEDSMQAMRALKTQFPQSEISVGDTPTCSRMEDFSGATEIRPGNFVFYDLMQAQIGACNYEQIAVALACPIVAKHEERNELIIYGGGVHFSKDSIEQAPYGKHYGRVVEATENAWSKPLENIYLKKLSQEHGTISAPAEFIKQKKIGDLVWVLPVHSCMAANLMPHYYHLDGRKITCLPHAV